MLEEMGWFTLGLLLGAAFYHRWLAYRVALQDKMEGRIYHAAQLALPTVETTVRCSRNEAFYPVQILVFCAPGISEVEIQLDFRWRHKLTLKTQGYLPPLIPPQGGEAIVYGRDIDRALNKLAEYLAKGDREAVKGHLHLVKGRSG